MKLSGFSIPDMEKSPLDYYPSQYKEVENLTSTKKKKKIDLKKVGEKILPPVAEKDLPWM
jgi:hypothetical protein